MDQKAHHLKPLETILGHQFGQPELLALALTHSSTARTSAERIHSNERLEFFGDRVLGLVISEMLFRRFPNENEGALARRLTSLVRREALSDVANRLGLGRFIVLSKGEEVAGGSRNPNLLADTCEAVIAALYLDGGLKVAERFIKDHWTAMMDDTKTPPLDAKTTLQEWAQGQRLGLPEYREVSRHGPDHAPEFTVEVAVCGYQAATGTGTSKRVAEQDAAAMLLSRVTGPVTGNGNEQR